MKTLNIAIVAAVAVVGLGAVYVWLQDDSDVPGDVTATSVYEFCSAYGMSEAYCTCNAEQAMAIFADHDWQAIRIMHEDGVEAMQAHMTENFDSAEWDAFVGRMNELDAMTAANCPPA